LLRQLMTEGLLLAIAGGAAGFGIALLACNLFSSWRLDIDIPFSTAIHPDAAVLFFTAAVSIFTTLLFALTPALEAMRTDLVTTLRNEAGLNRLRRWSLRDLIVAGQIALSVMLVISSALVIRSLQHALTLNLGFNPHNAVSVSFDLRMQGYNEKQSRAFDEALLRKAAALPGLASAGIISTLPLTVGGENSDIVSRADRPVPGPSERRVATVYNISPAYLRTAGTRLLAGRDVNAHDREGAPGVAIVNEALADLLFPRENPIGRHVRMSLDPADKGVEIVGEVETGKYESLGEDPHPVMFLPIAQTGTTRTTLVARTSLPAAAATQMLRNAVLDLDPELTLFNAGSLESQMALPLFPARIAAVVLGIFGTLAIVLAGAGLFAITAYAVSRRTREIGIRVALGARPSQVLRVVFHRIAVLCFTGLAFGIIVSLVASRLLSAVLYGLSPRDPATYATALLVMVLVVLLASWHPALRAIRVQPARTLREQ
jgi:predicted permease